LPTFYITATTKLPAGSTTKLFIAARLGTAIVGLGVNSILMVQYNWLLAKESKGEFSGLVMMAAVSLGVVGLLI
jgi:hypothetical protein